MLCRAIYLVPKKKSPFYHNLHITFIYFHAFTHSCIIWYRLVISTIFENDTEPTSCHWIQPLKNAPISLTFTLFILFDAFFSLFTQQHQQQSWILKKSVNSLKNIKFQPFFWVLLLPFAAHALKIFSKNNKKRWKDICT